MKTLAGYTLLYDAECPLCATYTKAFIKTGMLDAGGRAAYQQMPEAACPLVDRRRAINEIALVNSQTGEVTYGIRSLFKVIGNAMPVFKPLFNAGWFTWLMSKVYAFVSYNRKVIIPVKTVPGSMQPDFRLGYRIAYLLFTWLCVGFLLTRYNALFHGAIPTGNAYREYLICGGQIIFQSIAVLLLAKHKRWDYLGNMMTISMAGALALLPALLIAHFISLPVVFYFIYFMLIAGLMLLEHIRRIKLLALSGWLSVSWVLYRVMLLIAILYL
ncbi:hypothetical protein C8P68_102383 [Mucilaginibacter yixingensis]|uniref:Uncharacterized protein n=1 Tax=Mucilaginibacter yixingensis TaxID=1295612 RepID=A0A2T5JCR3_9SPHI|nr:DUF393 domain-containing protein [Mucilaginibacter yixingensis]PTQ99558.1 hypothetical protein C8P68_102383 [Mucilaginibacter yixingensis]